MSDNPIVALIRALVQNLDGAEPGWTAFALVLGLSGGKFNESYGYTYGPGSASAPISVRPRLVRSEVDAYLAGYFTNDDPLPIKLLVQFDQSLGRYEVTFEEKDTDRWRVAPSNLDRVLEELRPHFK